MARNTFTLTLTLLAAFAVRTLFLTSESLWRDEVDAIRFAFESLSTVVGQFGINGFNGLLYHIALRGWLTLTGIGDFQLRYFSVLFGVLLVVLVYVIGTRLFSRRAGVIAAWLAAASPVLSWYAGEGKMYSMQPALLTLALYALLRATRARRLTAPWWLVFVLSTAISFGVHILSPLFLAVAAVTVLSLGGGMRAHVKGIAIAVLAFAVPFASLLIARFNQLAAGGDIGHTFYPVPIIAQTLALNWTIGLDNTAPLFWQAPGSANVDLLRWMIVGLYFGLAALGAWVSSRRRSVAVALTWLLLPAALLFIVSLRVPLFQPRYVLWSAPALYVLAAAGADRLAPRRVESKLQMLVVTGTALASTTGYVGQLVNPIRPELREAIGWIKAELRPGDAIVFQIPYARHSFDYYARGLDVSAVELVDGPYTNDGSSEAEVDAVLAPVSAAHARIWLLETEAPMWDERGLTRGWLDEFATVADERDYRGISVTLYASQSLGTE
jgi:mannosyltransferase